jgi:hypothetical protein
MKLIQGTVLIPNMSALSVLLVFNNRRSFSLLFLQGPSIPLRQPTRTPDSYLYPGDRHSRHSINDIQPQQQAIHKGAQSPRLQMFQSDTTTAPLHKMHQLRKVGIDAAATLQLSRLVHPFRGIKRLLMQLNRLAPGLQQRSTAAATAEGGATKLELAEGRFGTLPNRE